MDGAPSFWRSRSMNKWDWIKSVLGAVLVAGFFWAFTAFVFLL